MDQPLITQSNSLVLNQGNNLGPGGNPPLPAVGGTAVQVVSSTWARDSHDLFDFEAQNLHTKTFTVPRNMKCIRTGTDVQMVPENNTQGPGTDPLLRLVVRDGRFWVDKSSPSSKKLWLVVRDLATCGHRLTEGDVIKLGRFKFRVRQMVASATGGAQPELRLDDNGAVCCADIDQDGSLKSTTCRICLLEGSGEDDPLITPCLCKGSIEYVHLGCLRHWIRGRLNLSDSQGSYFYRPLPCELCKAIYPTYVHIGLQKTPLVEVPPTQPPFIVLENMVRDAQQHTSRGLHVISLADKVLKLGRGHESDVRIADVSISRCHATIRFQSGQFILEDNNSKFGTLVALKKPRPLEAGSPISIQIGRTVLSLALQPHPDGVQTASAPLMQQLFGSNAEVERALRLSLLTRGRNEPLSEVRGDPEGNEGAGSAAAHGPPSIGAAEPTEPSEPGQQQDAMHQYQDTL